MTIAILQTMDSVHPAAGGVRTLAGMVQRLSKALPRHSRKPIWVRVPDRAWRRHSALLTYRHEARDSEQR